MNWLKSFFFSVHGEFWVTKTSNNNWIMLSSLLFFMSSIAFFFFSFQFLIFFFLFGFFFRSLFEDRKKKNQQNHRIESKPALIFPLIAWYDLMCSIIFCFYTNRLVDVIACFDRFERFQPIIALFCSRCFCLLLDTRILDTLGEPNSTMATWKERRCFYLKLSSHWMLMGFSSASDEHWKYLR